ncbi:Decarboxylase yanB [Wickerhamiella sorbophila]|uniref:6-methylsalicylate decarboxylase n=1 Tax=Wickerhamiella sorbophila TaxID=45607 RepID=A0A2T0FK32_9ASCO|nr:Decarboxylase yanB [Wickerhamiella sorbophila]PRT55338.1 Decarboxylase yanB [Wickerhamiella sorbophila]
MPTNSTQGSAQAGRNTRIDVHTHVVPPFWGEALPTHGGDPSGWALPAWSPETALEFMEVQKIQTKVLSLTAPGVTGWPIAERAAVCRRINEYVQDLCHKYPGRFGNFASLPLPDVEGSVKEVEYGLDTLGVDGFVVYTNYDGVYLGDKRFEPVWKAINDRKGVVFIHPSHLQLEVLAGQPGPLVDYPFDTTRTAVHMTLNGVLTRNPDIKFILSHAGGFLPYAALRFAKLGASIHPQGPSSEEILKQFKSFYFDTALSSGPYALPALLEFAGKDHILYGSDFPYASAAVSGEFTHLLDNGSNIPEETTHAINTNAAKILKRFQ